MKDFLKYTALGLLGLSLGIAWPQVPVNWAAIVLTQAYLSGTRRWAPWSVLFLLAFAYSAFSLSGPLAFAWPWVLAWLICLGLRRSFRWEGTEERALLLALLSSLPLLGGAIVAWGRGGGWVLDWRDWLGAVATFGVGFFGAPLLSFFFGALLRKLAFFRRRRGGIDLSRANWLSARGSRLGRKPFGLEKGL